MTARSIRTAAASLVAIAIAGCTTTGVGTGQSATGNVGATFTWTETGGTQGTMVAQLSNGQVYQGPMFQITSESRSATTARCGRMGRRLRLGPRLGGPLGWGWGGWGPWGPTRRRSLIIAARSLPICGSRRLHALRFHADEPELRHGRRRHRPVPAAVGNDHQRAVPARIIEPTGPRIASAGPLVADRAHGDTAQVGCSRRMIRWTA